MKQKREFERGLRAGFLQGARWLEIKARLHDSRQPWIIKTLKEFAKDMRKMAQTKEFR